MVFNLKAVLGDVLHDCSFSLLKAGEEISFIMRGEKVELTLEKLPHGGKVVRSLPYQ